MAKVHILHSVGTNRHAAVAHFNTNTGNNAVGIAWKDILLQYGVIGNTAQAWSDSIEQSNIESGDIVEIPFTIILDPNIVVGATRTAAIDAEADSAIAAWVNDIQIRYNYSGYSQGTVS